MTKQPDLFLIGANQAPAGGFDCAVVYNDNLGEYKLLGPRDLRDYPGAIHNGLLSFGHELGSSVSTAPRYTPTSEPISAKNVKTILQSLNDYRLLSPESGVPDYGICVGACDGTDNASVIFLFYKALQTAVQQVFLAGHVVPDSRRHPIILVRFDAPQKIIELLPDFLLKLNSENERLYTDEFIGNYWPDRND